MSAAGDYVMNKAHRLVQHCGHMQSLLRIVIDWTDQGLYDPISDVHNIRLPGAAVRAIRAALQPQEGDQPPSP